MTEIDTLPDDPSLLKAMLVELTQQLQKHRRNEEHLRQRLDQLLRKLYGKRSEKLDPNQISLLDIEALAAQGSSIEPTPDPPAVDLPATSRKSRRRPKRRRPSKELSRVRREHTLPEAERLCSCCQAPMSVIRTETHEQLDYEPASVYVVEHVHAVYGCRAGCDEKVERAPKPPQLVEKGLPGPGLLAYVATSKYADHRVPRRRVQQPRGRRSKPCCMEDEGRPLGIGVQARVPNHLELRGSRARVVSVEETARQDRVR